MIARILLCGAMVGMGSMVVLSPVASARGGGSGSNFYVSPSGIDTGNACVNHQFPCQTIAHALAEEALFANGGTIHLSAGTYTGQVDIGPSNTSVSIVGTSVKRTIIQPPSSGLTSAVDPNSVNPVHPVIEVSGGASNVTIEKLAISGTNGVASLDTDGQGCAQSYVGIYFDDSSGTVSGVNVTGMDVPLDQFGTCASGRGIYVASDASAGSFVTIDQTSVAVAPCTTTLTLPLAAGSYSNSFVGLKKIKQTKGCKFHGGPILIDGALLTAQPFGAHTVQITGTMPYLAPGGSIVSFNPLGSAYDAAGMVCENATTTCEIEGGTFQGIGPNDQVSQDGIEVLGASATISSTKVSDDSFSGGGAMQASAGIKVVNGGTVQLTGNTLDDNDVNIAGTWNPSLGVTDPASYPPLSPGRSVPSSDGLTTAGQDTLTSASAAFQQTDVGRAIASSFIYPDGSTNIAGSFSDGVSNGTATFTSATADFTAADQGQPIVETDQYGEIFPGTTIQQVENATTVVLSRSASTAQTGVAFILPSRATTFTSATADFTSADVGHPLVETDLQGVVPSGTTISSVISSTAVLVSKTLLASATGIAFDLPSRSTGIAPGTYVAAYVSPEVVLMSQPATGTMSGLTLALGALPGTWTLTGNTASSATDFGASAGTAGYGEGIDIDSVDGCADGNENAALVVQGNTASNNPAAGILLNGTSCAVIGGSAASQGNSASGNHVGLEFAGPGSDCSPCTAPTDPAYDSAGNLVVGNSFSGNNFGVLAHGFTAPQTYGGPPAIGPATGANIFNGNTWTSNSSANAVDFTGWGGLLIGGVSFVLGSTPAGSYTSLTSTTPQTLPAGRIIQISQAGLPNMNVIVSSAVSAATVIPVTPFTATGDYTGATALVNQIPGTATTSSYGLTTHDSCEPSPNGSASFNGVTFSAGYDSC